MKLVKKMFDKVREISLIPCIIKTAILTLAIVGGFFWWPLMLIGLILGVILICMEFDVNSLYVVLFFLPFMEVFKVFDIVCWRLFLYAYMLMLTIKTIYYLVSKKLAFDWKILTVFLVLIAYFCIPNSGYLYGAKWFLLFYLLITNRSGINSKLIFTFFVWGTLSCCFIGLFARNIASISSNIKIHREDGFVRYSALFSNPNALYPFIITSMAIVFANVLLKKSHLLNILYILPLIAFGFATISKTFLICLAAFAMTLVLALLIKPNKHKLIVVGSTLVCCVLGALIVFGQTSALFSRLSVEEAADMAQNNLNDSEYNQLLTGRLEIWKAYIAKYLSSAKSILLGNGVSSCVSLEIGGCHSSIIQILYDFGLIGALLIVFAVLYIPLHLNYFKTKWLTVALLPLIVTLLPMTVEIIFLADNWSCLIILSALALSTNTNLNQKNPTQNEQTAVSQQQPAPSGKIA